MGFALDASPAMSAETRDSYVEQRRRMLDEIAQTTRDTAAETGRQAISERVMAALAKVPRHRFVSSADERAAYDNRPLSIGLGQTISQPFIVALMTDILEVQPDHRILEIGTGSGYQGWEEHAPFDGIMVTAAAREVPQPLIDQLRNGGRIVIPLGDSSFAQTLYLLEKTHEGKIIRRPILGVRFVPLTRKAR